MYRLRLPRWCNAVLLTCVFSALALGPFQSTRQATSVPAAARVTLRFAFSNAAFEARNNMALIKAFEATHPNITIKPEPISGSVYAQKLFLEANAHTLPDVIWTIDALVTPFARRHVVLDLQPLIARDHTFDVEDIYAPVLKTGRVPGDNGLYMLPREVTAITLFYNKTMFKAAGVPFPAANWTYADFLNAAQRLTKKGAGGQNTQWGLDLSDFYWWPIVVPWMVGFGGTAASADGKHATFSAPGSVKGIQALADLFLKYKVVAPPGPALGATPLDPFVMGKAAMFPSVRAFVPGFRQVIGKAFDWDAQLMPPFPNGKRVVGLGASGYSVAAATQHRAAAWSFVRFIASAAGQRVFAGTYAAIPSRRSLANDPSWRKLPGPPYNNDAFVEGVAYGILPPAFPVDASLACGTFYSGQVSTEIANALTEIVRGAGRAAPTLAGLDRQINSCIDQLPH